jgi:hypothetical protein
MLRIATRIVVVTTGGNDYHIVQIRTFLSLSLSSSSRLSTIGVFTLNIPMCCSDLRPKPHVTSCIFHCPPLPCPATGGSRLPRTRLHCSTHLTLRMALSKPVSRIEGLIKSGQRTPNSSYDGELSCSVCLSSLLQFCIITLLKLFYVKNSRRLSVR